MWKILESQRRSEVREKLGKSRELAEFEEDASSAKLRDFQRNSER
jgi:hypothetical protein